MFFILMYVYMHIYIYIYIHCKKCWVKYNPALGKIWMNPVIGLFLPSGWVTAQKAGLNI